ncbi:helix-turn-helix domain-containing GNAT family N-acetyltransferase [Streptomyces sp. NPDC047968]|uniref:bifunctional helix-turn-helix transcriptional regulator/GNAT family N-acetyltransferase n=1 Tax=unclassified Streptomyces TaxID=2593676 RepID=UPI003413F48C
MQREQIDQVRRFNRTVTARVGVLHDSYLGRDRSIGAARLLWEIDADEGSDVRRLRDRLGLDSGYVSRLLRSLEADGLVTVERQARDGRVRTVRLTAAGREELATLDGRSDELACSLLEPLNEVQKARLVRSMAEVDRLLTAATVTVDAVDPDHPDARHCMGAYFAELHERLSSGYDPDQSLLPDASGLRPPQGLLLLARLHGEPVGCAGLKLPEGAPAEIKRMWVAPGARRLGLGRRFLAELETRARGLGRTVLRLDSNGHLEAALALYRSCGYREVPAFNDEPYADHWFEKHLDDGPAA